MNTQELTATGRELAQSFKIFDIEILQENYSATIDFGREMSDAYKHQLRNKGFEITHERDTIYTIQK